MSLVSLVEWNVSLGSADVSLGRVRAVRTAAKETIRQWNQKEFNGYRVKMPVRGTTSGCYAFTRNYQP